MKANFLIAATMMLGATGLFSTPSYAASKALVAYVSNSGHTEFAAQKLAKNINADLYDIKSSSKSIEKYNVVFLGFPLKANEEPTEIDTFITSNDFSGKTIVPFVPMSDKDTMDKITTKIQTLAPNAKVETGKAVGIQPTSKSLKTWANKVM